ncbi:FmdB family zinc ribbon protein [Miltoncostaea marina]|uniref:FmdB family zinc ribbon protein n=1 Tax=Miltoncostaea marina TaxID=2843215 RepID=UPI001C3DE465|nr:zinc ribbon domain-containing protein [Miltoncostaea marina]
MPSYDLVCGSCDTAFEAFRQGFLRDEDRVCPTCGAPEARQLFTGFVTARPAREGAAPSVVGFGGGGGGCCGGSCGCGG